MDTDTDINNCIEAWVSTYGKPPPSAQAYTVSLPCPSRDLSTNSWEVVAKDQQDSRVGGANYSVSMQPTEQDLSASGRERISPVKSPMQDSSTRASSVSVSALDYESAKAKLAEKQASADEWVYALDDYVPSPEEVDHLPFAEEDVIKVLEKLNEAWWIGEIVGDKRGIKGKFPTELVEVFSIFMKGSEKDKKDKATSGKKTLKDKVKSKVSKKKRRFMKEGFNLDLTYITPNVIAMGFPSDSLAGMYRNHVRDVQRFLNQRHQDNYKIYNLCSERDYKAALFEGRVARYPFDDHNPCPFNMIEPFCKDVHEWVSEKENRIAAIHCKAGKGRTGLLITCYLLWDKTFATSALALRYYAIKRTMDAKGITIPSQLRYVHYFERLLVMRAEGEELPESRPLTLTTLRLRSVMGGRELDPAKMFFTITTNEGKMSSKGKYKCQGRLAEDYMFWAPNTGSGIATLDGDVRIQVYQDTMFDKEKLFQLWINTRFVNSTENFGHESQGASLGAPTKNNIILTFGKMQLDKACKDIAHSLFSDKFTMELQLRKDSSAASPMTPSRKL